MSGNAFTTRMQTLLRSSGYTQRELADALNLHPKVLSRKLNGNGSSHLTHLEVRNIIFTLSRYFAITTQDEALQLLALAEVGPNLFSDEEWHAPPLNQLVAKSPAPGVSIDAPVPTTTPRHNLQAPTTRFIGREWAVERLRQLFETGDVRLVTLVGSGGSGKTSLALHVAHELVQNFEHGVWFVPLAGVSSPMQVPMSIIQSLDIKPAPDASPIDSLCAYLQNKRLLLILDNFEHVMAAANSVDALLAAAPGLKVLVTSRARLHLYGEHILGVPPLDVPNAEVSLKTTELVHYEAIQLFVERAHAATSDFALTDENKAVIVQICIKLDGLPLALELAAARIRVLAPTHLLERLTNARLSFLTGGAKNLPGRQQTLRNTIAWSYNLLVADERTWFPRLGIFSGGWSLETAEAMVPPTIMAQDESFMLDIITRLLDSSLLVRPPGTYDQARYSMLETLREYALEQLAAQGEAERWRDWHACHYLKYTEEAELGLRGPQQLMWLKRLMADHDNFRAAMLWLLQRAREGMTISLPSSLEQNEAYWPVAGSKTLSLHAAPWTGRTALELCLRLASALRHYLEWRGYLTEGRDWLQVAIALPFQPNGEETLLAARAKALSETARIMSLHDQQMQSAILADQSIALWQQLDDPAGLATALLHRAWPVYTMGDYQEAMRLCEEGLQQLDTTNEVWLRAQLLCYVGAAAGFSFDFPRMRSCYQQSIQLFEQVGDSSAVADVLKDHGGMLIMESEYAASISHLLRSITLCRELGHKQYIATGLGWLTIAIGMRGEPDLATASLHAATLQGATESFMEAIGMTHWSKTHPLVQAVFQYIRSHVDEQSWEAALTAGQALTMDQAIELAYQWGER